MGENEQNNSVNEPENSQNENLTENENTFADGRSAQLAEETQKTQNAEKTENAPSDEEAIRAAALAEEYARREYFAARRYRRAPLILAMIGLILSFFYGAGFAFSVAAIVTAAVRSRKVKSPAFRWALAVGVTGAAICLVCYAMLIAAVCMPARII